ncbi:MAG: type II toxin-antitoxin system VapB family antitoxin [Acidimicrobiales bacterium]|nr:type II toxin-antitoxin system VapB family antitoxin [Acidimicrobiales bacterium]
MCPARLVGRTNIVIDDELVANAKQLYGFETTREVVDFALRRCVTNFDNLHTLRRAAFRQRITTLPAPRMDQACQTLARAVGCV